MGSDYGKNSPYRSALSTPRLQLAIGNEGVSQIPIIIQRELLVWVCTLQHLPQVEVSDSFAVSGCQVVKFLLKLVSTL